MRTATLFLLVSALFFLACDDATDPSPDQDAGLDSGPDMAENDMRVDMPDEDLGADADMSVEDMADMSQDTDQGIVLEDCSAGCTAPAVCVTGACVEPVTDLEAYANEAQSRSSSYVRSIQSPAAFDPAERCCADFNGDGRDDDSIGTMLGLLQSIPNQMADPIAEMNDRMRDDELALVFDWRVLPASDGPARFSIFKAANDVDQNGAADMQFDDAGSCVTGTRCGGDGTFSLLGSSFGDYGAITQFNNASITNGSLAVLESSTINLPLSLGLFSGGIANLDIENLQVSGDLLVVDGQVTTVDTTATDSNGATYTVAGGKLAGTVQLESWIGNLDDAMRACSCAGLNADMPVITWTRNLEMSVMEVACTDNRGAPGQCTGTGVGDGEICPEINTICSTLSVLGSVADVDTDGDTINESFSIGLRFSLTTAAVDGVVAPN